MATPNVSLLHPNLTRTDNEHYWSMLTKELNQIDFQLAPKISRILHINPSKHFPYHGNLHTVLFVLGVCELLKQYPDLTKQQQISLVVAGTFHDFDYLSAKGDDIHNIKRARLGFATYSDSFNVYQLDRALVSKLIHATYLKDDISQEDPNYLLYTIMRDSDFIGACEPVYKSVLLPGFREEKGIEPFNTLTDKFTIYNEYALKKLQSSGW